MHIRRLLVGILAATIFGACGGGTAATTAAVNDDPTTTGQEATTAPVTEETRDPGAVSSLDDVPAECLEAYRSYLQQIEPIVADFDFDSASMEEFSALGTQFEEATGAYEENTASCPSLDMTDEESFDAMIEFAENEAPGTVAYFEFLRDFVGTMSSDTTSAGDCESDIAAVQELVDRGGSMNDLTASEFGAISGLLGSITAKCSPERANEFLTKDDVADWLIGG